MPDVVAPTATNTGTNDDNPLAALAGSSAPFTSDRLTELYGDLEGYARAWDAAVDDPASQELILASAIAAVRERGRLLGRQRFDA
jgi:hypothetical protein